MYSSTSKYRFSVCSFGHEEPREHIRGRIALGSRMKTMGLLSPGTSQPAMFCHGVMNNNFERKVQFGGHDKKYYRHIRRKLARFWKEDYKEDWPNGKAPRC